MTTLVAEPQEAEIEKPTPAPSEDEANYWITPVKSMPEESAQECIQKLVGTEKIYAFGERTPGRKHIKPGDWLCFYASGGVGVSAHAQVASYPEDGPHPAVRQPERYPWVFDLRSPKLYLDNPTVIDAELRAKLDAFKDKDPSANWAWFVQATRRISRHDFMVLTHQLED
jgi:hypothetical protein